MLKNYTFIPEADIRSIVYNNKIKCNYIGSSSCSDVIELKRYITSNIKQKMKRDYDIYKNIKVYYTSTSDKNYLERVLIMNNKSTNVIKNKNTNNIVEKQEGYVYVLSWE